jgi:hypothetical protein
MAKVASAGFICGMMMVKMNLTYPQPSSAAASSSSRGMLLM